MKRYVLTAIFAFSLAIIASAQVRVTGRVIDLQNKPVSDVIVKLVSGTKTLAFTSSNAKGQQVREILKNMSASRIGAYIVKEGDWSEGRFFDTDQDFEDHKDIVFRDIKSDDENATFEVRIWHRYDAIDTWTTTFFSFRVKGILLP